MGIYERASVKKGLKILKNEPGGLSRK